LIELIGFIEFIGLIGFIELIEFIGLIELMVNRSQVIESVERAVFFQSETRNPDKPERIAMLNI
jgi:hypothetical protein